MNWIDEYITDYYSFLKKNTLINNIEGEWVTITTPFVGLFNDYINIYIKKDDKELYVSDDGETISNLMDYGINIEKSPNRKLLLEKILNNFSTKILNNVELAIKGKIENRSQILFNFISAIQEINNFYLISKEGVSSMFKEDVRQFFEKKDILYTPEFISKGSTGLEFTFDFQIASKKAETVIKTFSNINKYSLSNFLFSWDDIKKVREAISQKEVLGLAVINDADKEVRPEYLEALKTKSADYILFSKIEEEVNVAKFRAEK